jgi:intracellular sulfur oxidation DsrE/DsrF family protein
MKRSHLIASLLLAALLPLSALAAESAAAPTPPAEEVMKAVFHVDFSDPRRLSATIQSVNNMVTVYQQQLQEYDVRIVFVSHGIRFLTSDPLTGTPFAADKELTARRKEFADRLSGLQKTQDVKLELCEITREAVRLDKEKLLPGVVLVRSGVVQLAELQRQGFAYIKVE